MLGAIHDPSLQQNESATLGHAVKKLRSSPGDIKSLQMRMICYEKVTLQNAAAEDAKVRGARVTIACYGIPVDKLFLAIPRQVSHFEFQTIDLRETRCGPTGSNWKMLRSGRL